MTATPRSDGSLVLSFLNLRRAIGVIGIALPFVLAIGAMAFGCDGIQASISVYYYTPMRNVLVGSLCAIAVFLLSYRGYDARDGRTSNAAGAFALGVALLPGTPPVPQPSDYELLIGKAHLFCATGFLIALALFPLWLFRLSDQPRETMPPRKKRRNQVYAACGSVMVVSLAVLWATIAIPEDSPLLRWDPVFWFEAFAVVAFGISWLTKGEAILADTK